MKKSGFTLIEMIIVMALSVVVLGILYSIFYTGSKVFSDSDVKSTLQMEARDIQEKLTSIGMQGTGVPVEPNSHTNEIIINGYDKDSVYFTDGSGEISNPKQYDIKFLGTSPQISLYINRNTLATNIKSFSVIPESVDGGFVKASSMEFDIVLHQKKGFSDVDYPFKVKVTFRNKGN